MSLSRLNAELRVLKTTLREVCADLAAVSSALTDITSMQTSNEKLSESLSQVGTQYAAAIDTVNIDSLKREINKLNEGLDDILTKQKTHATQAKNSLIIKKNTTATRIAAKEKEIADYREESSSSSSSSSGGSDKQDTDRYGRK